MGGVQSKVDNTSIINTLSKTTVKTSQNCASTAAADQNLSIIGNSNIATGNVQKATISINKSCLQKSDQQSKLSDAVKNSLSQTLSDSGVALTGWANAGNSTIKSNLYKTVQNENTVTNAQNCFGKLDSKQTLLVVGSGNVVDNNSQISDMSLLIKNCMQDNSNISNLSSFVSQTAQQHSKSVNKNPLSFITDAIGGVTKSVATMVVLAGVAIFVSIIVAIILWKFMSSPAKEVNYAPVPVAYR